jgi:hypothetical protein
LIVGALASIDVYAECTCDLSVITTVSASITAVATVTCIGFKQGQEWSVVPEVVDMWTDVVDTATTWTPVPSGGGSWSLRL